MAFGGRRHAGFVAGVMPVTWWLRRVSPLTCREAFSPSGTHGATERATARPGWRRRQTWRIFGPCQAPLRRVRVRGPRQRACTAWRHPFRSLLRNARHVHFGMGKGYPRHFMPNRFVRPDGTAPDADGRRIGQSILHDPVACCRETVIKQAYGAALRTVLARAAKPLHIPGGVPWIFRTDHLPDRSRKKIPSGNPHMEGTVFSGFA